MNSFESAWVPRSLLSEFVCGAGPVMHTLNAMVTRIAPTRIPVLIMGECGTGKDTYARLIHRLSQRTEATFHRIDCASLAAAGLVRQPNIQRGGGHSEKDWGTIYLDGIQDLDQHCQRVLLSYLCDDEDSVENRGLHRRLISSANTRLELEVEGGRFRSELYFRINGACIRLPPLRERKDDILALLEYFLRKHSSAKEKTFPPVSRGVQDMLLEYSWPGNIRQLENLALTILTLGETRALDELHSLPSVSHRPARSLRVPSLKMAVRAASRQTERELIIQALERTRWNRKQAAEELRISYKSFLNKLKAIETTPGGAVDLKEGK